MRLEINNGQALGWVTMNMRVMDRVEIMACMPREFSLEDVIHHHAHSGSFWVAGLERPVVAIGRTNLHPGVCAVWMYATDEFDKIALSFTKWVMRDFTEGILRENIHRAEARSLAEHHEAHRWMEFTGAVREAPLRRFGRDEEDFYLYAWRSD